MNEQKIYGVKRIYQHKKNQKAINWTLVWPYEARGLILQVQHKPQQKNESWKNIFQILEKCVKLFDGSIQFLWALDVELFKKKRHPIARYDCWRFVLSYFYIRYCKKFNIHERAKERVNCPFGRSRWLIGLLFASRSDPKSGHSFEKWRFGLLFIFPICLRTLYLLCQMDSFYKINVFFL